MAVPRTCWRIGRVWLLSRTRCWQPQGTQETKLDFNPPRLMQFDLRALLLGLGCFVCFNVDYVDGG